MIRSALQHAQDVPSGQSTGGGGPEVDLNIAFPPNQTGLDNVTVIRLVPVDAGAHEVDAVAQVRGTSIVSVFLSTKDEQPGHTYVVVASDAAHDSYPVGQIQIGGDSRQVFNISAPLLTPNSPQLQPGAPVQANAPPVQPSNDGNAEAGVQGGHVMQRWAMGLTLKTITPALLAASGHLDSKLRGLLVTRVVPGSPADRAGIQVNDVIVKMNGSPSSDIKQLATLTADRRHGVPTDLTMYSQRGKAVVTVSVPVDLAFVPPSQPSGYIPSQAAGAVLVQPEIGPGFVEPDTEEYSSPSVGLGYVPGAYYDYRSPRVGPGFQEPGTSRYHSPQEGGYIQGGGTDSNYGMRRAPPTPPSGPNTGWKPPAAGPGFVEPGTGSGPTTAYHPPQAGNNNPSGNTASIYGMRRVQPTPPSGPNTGWQPPAAGPGVVQPGTGSGQPATYHPAHAGNNNPSGNTASIYGMRRVQPTPPSGPNTGWRAPVIGPGVVQPGSDTGHGTVYHAPQPRPIPVQPVSHRVKPAPPRPSPAVHANPQQKGSNQFRPPTTGPGLKHSGSS